MKARPVAWRKAIALQPKYPSAYMNIGNQQMRQGKFALAIRELLGTGPVPTQQLLVTELARRGFTPTQSSVSRDLRDLGVAKVGERYLALYRRLLDAPAGQGQAGSDIGSRRALV